MQETKYGPETLGIITTYRCVAECKECCFECNTHSPEKLSFDQIKKVIDDAAAVGSVKLVVWTGGECTLLGKELIKGISYAYSKGLPSRIVSNGWWARTPKIAKKKVKELIDAGLRELNISTGDNHQEFIKADTAILAAVTGAELGIISVLSIERTKYAKFTPETLIQNPVYKKFVYKNINIDKLRVINPVWISFHQDTQYQYDKQDFDSGELNEGCNNIMTFIGVEPSGNYIGCCGLTMRYIKSMKLGDSKKKTLETAYYQEYNDFMKRWIFVDGPLKIMKKVHDWDNSIRVPAFPHSCHYCALVFNDLKIQETIIKNYKDIEKQINADFVSKIDWCRLKAEKNTVNF